MDLASMCGDAASRRLVGALALALTAVPLSATPASAAFATCTTSTSDRPAAGIATAGDALGRGLFLTYADGGAVRKGGTVAPLDLGAPTAHASVDRTGLGNAVAGVVDSAYSDAAGASSAKVRGRPPQQQERAGGGGACARLSEGPMAEAAANAASLSPNLSVRLGEVHATTGPKGAGSKSASTVVLTDVAIGELRIEEIVLTAVAVADGKDGDARISSVVNGITVAGQRIVWDEAGIDPLLTPPPDTETLKAFGIELVSSGSSGHSSTGSASTAVATGPVLRVTALDGRVATVVLGEARASAERTLR